MPPTSTSSLISFSVSCASFKHAFTGGIVRWNKSSQSCSILERVSFFWMCFGPLASAVMNGRLISYSWVEESAIFAFSDFEHGNIERAATQVVDGDLFVLLFVQAVGQ